MKSLVSNFDKVKEFATVFGPDQPYKHSSDYDLMKFDLIEEEFHEASEAFLHEDPLDSTSAEALLKELVDLLYVVYGYANYRGWDIDTAFNRVHSSNMSKLGEDGKPIYREDGKVLKGPNYRKPNLMDLVT